VTIILVREVETFDEGFEAGHDAIGHGLPHEFACARQRFRFEVRTIRENIAEALVEDWLGPPSARRPCLRNTARRSRSGAG
jgi:hypothetical protein